MNHQITLEELGLIPKSEKKYVEPRKYYASPCGGKEEELCDDVRLADIFTICLTWR